MLCQVFFLGHCAIYTHASVSLIYDVIHSVMLFIDYLQCSDGFQSMHRDRTLQLCRRMASVTSNSPPHGHTTYNLKFEHVVCERHRSNRCQATKRQNGNAVTQ